MTNIIQFPRGNARNAVLAPVLAPVPAPVPVKRTQGFSAWALLAGLLRGLVSFLWLLILICWPVFTLMVSMDLLFQFGRMIYYWHTPGVHAGWMFLAHFAAIVALTCFVAVYEPKCIRE